MNYSRIALAAVAATVFCYGFLVYGTLLSSQFERYPAVYRNAETGAAFLPLMFGGLFVAIIVVSIMYATGYAGGSGVAEGARFGLLLGLFVVFAFAGVNYAVLNIGKKLAVMVAAAGFFEWLLIGVIIGLVYKGVPKSAAQTI